MTEQVLDNNPIERERGITIKAQAVQLHYKAAQRRRSMSSNLIDTPGHVDFSYEVSALAGRPAKARCWWWTRRRAWEAQSVANCYTAIEQELEVMPGAEQGSTCRTPSRTAWSTRSSR